MHIFSILLITVIFYSPMKAFAVGCSKEDTVQIKAFCSGEVGEPSGAVYDSCEKAALEKCNNLVDDDQEDRDQCEWNGTRTWISATSTAPGTCVPKGETAATGSTNPACAPLVARIPQCTSKKEAAVSSCNPDNNSSYTGAISEVNDIRQGINGLTGGALSQMCNKALQAATVGADGLSLFEDDCKGARTQCQDVCSSLKKELEQNNCATEAAQVQSNVSSCDGLKAKESKAAASAAELRTMPMQIQACNEHFAAEDLMKCFSNPTAPGCPGAGGVVKNCDDPTYAAQNVVCLCRNPASRGDPRCSGIATKPGQDSSLVDGSLAAGSNKSYSNGAKLDISKMLGAMDDAALAAAKAKAGDAEDVGGKMGGGANVDGGGGGSGSPSGDTGGSAYSGINPNILAGSRGGSGGGGGWGSGGGSIGLKYNSTSENSKLAGPPGPNFNNFHVKLPPGGRRNPAGVVGPDGLMGPLADLWFQMSNRYNYKFQKGELIRP